MISFYRSCLTFESIYSQGGGENVAPVPIEDDIKAELGEVVSQAMLVGIFFFKNLPCSTIGSKKMFFYQLLDLRKKNYWICSGRRPEKAPGRSSDFAHRAR